MRTIWLLVNLLAVLRFGKSVPKPQVGLLTKLPCTLPSIALVGGDLPTADGGGGIKTRDPEECRYECHRRAQCQFWSHVKDWQINCYLKSVAGEERQMDGAITGWKGDGCSEGLSQSREQISRLEQEIGKRRPTQFRRHGLLDDSGCRIEDIVFLGYDLPPERNGDGIRLRSFVECRTACRDQPGCKAFTFVKDWDVNCFLKEAKGEESEFVGAESGTLEPCEPKQRPIPSSPLSSDRFRPTTSQDSPKLIRTTNFPSRSTVRNPLIRRRPNSEVHVVQAETVAPSPSPILSNEEECMFEDTNFLGGGLPADEGGQGIETSDADGCNEECKRRTKCRFWTFVSKWKVNCYLKSRLGERADFEGGISGAYGSDCVGLSKPEEVSTGNIRPSSNNECIFEDTNFLGGGLSVEEGGQGIETKDHGECSLECQRRPKCNFWTFVGKWKVNCYLKSRLGEKSEFDGGISGTFGPFCDKLRPRRRQDGSNLSLSIPSTSSDLCLFENTNFLGGGLTEEEGGQGIETKDYADCDEECRKRSKCHYWTFVEKWKVNCYLKSRLGERSEFEGGLSGTYGTRCRLKTASSVAEVPRPSPIKPVSHPNVEGIKDGSGCRFIGVNFQGGDLSAQDGGHGLETDDADHCREECARRPNCQHWTHVAEWKVNCYLKEQKGPVREFEGATSGTLLIPCDKEAEDTLGELGTIRDNEHECAYEDLTFKGADLPAKHGGLGITTPNAASCRMRCLQSRYCKYWIHINDWKVNCYLKSDRVTPEKKEGAVSGSIGKRCLSGATSLPVSDQKHLLSVSGQNSFKPPIVVPPTNNRKDHCRYPGLNYQGGDLSTNQGGNGLATSSADECSSECEKRSVCQFWTYVDDWKVNCYLKSSFDEQNYKDGATSGSIGVKCDEGYVIPSLPESSSVSNQEEPAISNDNVPSNKVPRRPQSSPETVCFFKGVNVLGGDLPADEGGRGIAQADANACAVACYEREKCKYWVFITGWKDNCFLKSHFEEEETFPDATTGSIGLSCE